MVAEVIQYSFDKIELTIEGKEFVYVISESDCVVETYYLDRILAAEVQAHVRISVNRRIQDSTSISL